ncbi:MAG: GatB/YqeY domain-containing protein [Candidatus Omnitrophota bacterium]
MLEQQINENFKQAMRDRDAIRVSTLSFLRAQLKNVMIDHKVDSLEDSQIIVVIKKQIKQRQDSIEQFGKGGRQDLVDKEKAELEILKSYLPKEMGPEELKKLVEESIQEAQASGIKDMGKVMKVVMPKTAGQADNKQISELVKQLLTQM